MSEDGNLCSEIGVIRNSEVEIFLRDIMPLEILGDIHDRQDRLQMKNDEKEFHNMKSFYKLFKT